MAVPTNRNEFKAYCLRKLGAPAIRVKVTETQVDDRIDEAIQTWGDYYFDGSEKVFYKHQIEQADIDSQSITLPENIIGAVRIFDVGVINSAIANPFNLNYQIALNDLYTLASSSMVPYYAMNIQLELIEQMLVGQKPIRYNRLNNVLHVDMNWQVFIPGQYILVEAYEVVDPDVYTGAWSNRILQNYATALIKQQWAQNEGIYDAELVGGIKVNYQKMAEEAAADIEKWEQFMFDGNLPEPINMG